MRLRRELTCFLGSTQLPSLINSVAAGSVPGHESQRNRPSHIQSSLTNIFELRGGGAPSSPKPKLRSSLELQFRTVFPWFKADNVSPTVFAEVTTYSPLRMYLSCMGIVLVWITSGTLFYSYCNDWPLAQSFFYAVDAGLSIGFCTEVHETKLVSKAFTILYILLGASVIGGALALFIQDAVEGVASPSVDEYKVLLERKHFEKADLDHSGVLTYSDFETLLQSSFANDPISQEDLQYLWTKFDQLKDGVIHFEEFTGTFRGIHHLIESLHRQQAAQNPIRRILAQLRIWIQQAWQLENRIYFVFVLWISIGILWGMLDQHWDPITATHFAISALATGGLTAPQVNADGILPADPAIFCGIFCLIGVPLFALTLGHYAKVLVSDHIAALERQGLTRSMTEVEYELAAHLTTKDSVVHFSDFIILQLLRQGKLNVEAVQVLKQNFDLLDTNQSGTLSLHQATSPPPMHPIKGATAE